jgi:hypothetical protein
VSRAERSARTAYSANVAGSNCIGPSAPLRFLPWYTPRAWDRPLSDSMVPIPASTSQSSPGQVRAAAAYQARYRAGIAASPETRARGLSGAAAGGTSRAPVRTSMATVRLSAAIVRPRIVNTQHLCTSLTQSNHADDKE